MVNQFTSDLYYIFIIQNLQKYIDLLLNNITMSNVDNSPKSSKSIRISITSRHPLQTNNSQPSIKIQTNRTKIIKSPQSDLQKLLQISGRCQSYYERFSIDKQKEIYETQFLFAELQHYLESTFLNLFQLIENRKNELKLSIQDKKQQLLNIKNQQYECLSQKIDKVIERDRYFTTLLRNADQLADNLYIADFATLLNTFYEQIQSIEKINYMEQIRQGVACLKDVIETESASYNSNATPENTDGTISFNNGHHFSQRDEIAQDSWEDYRKLITATQQKREINIGNYQYKIRKPNQQLVLIV